MPCKLPAHFLPGISAVLTPYEREKPAARKFLISFAGIDKRKPPPEVLENGVGVFSALDRLQEKLLFRIPPFKESLYAHRLRREHHGNAAKIGDFL